MEEKKTTRTGMISENNVRISLVIPKTLKAELDRVAKEQNRSISNLISTTLMTVFGTQHKEE